MKGKIFHFLDDAAWDAPFFKRLAHNDTGSASGHQSGVFIPRDIRCYFPELDEDLISGANPTTDRYLTAEMFILDQQVATAIVRYQLQTWTGTRTPERRITANLGPVLNHASGGDLLVMQRSRDKLEVYRLILVRKSDVAYAQIDKLRQNKSCGALYPSDHPMSQTDLITAKAAMLAEAAQPFVAIRSEIPRTVSARTAIARDTAFRETLLAQYQRCCAVSGISLTANSVAEVQAAHVVGLARGGADEPRNGLVLTGTLHWAFDKGLFSVSDTRRVIIPDRVMSMPENAWLSQFRDSPILEASKYDLRTAPEAFAWHRDNLLAQWN